MCYFCLLCRLQEFITDFVQNAFLGQVHARVSENIDTATRGNDVVFLLLHVLILLFHMSVKNVCILSPHTCTHMHKDILTHTYTHTCVHNKAHMYLSLVSPILGGLFFLAKGKVFKPWQETGYNHIQRGQARQVVTPESIAGKQLIDRE